MAKKAAKNDKPEEDPWVVSRLDLVAKFFHTRKDTVRSWKSVHRMPCDNGRYDLSEIFLWWAARQKEGDVAESKLKHKKLELEVQRQALELQKDAGKLIDRGAAKSGFTQMLHRVRTRLQAIPSELGTNLPPELRPEYVDDAENKIRLILKTMEEWALEGDSNDDLVSEDG